MLCTLCVAFNSHRSRQREIDAPCVRAGLLWSVSDLTITLSCQCFHVATGSLHLGSPLSSKVTTRLLPLVLRSIRVDFTLLAVDMVNLVSLLSSQSWASSSSSTSKLSDAHSDAFPSLRSFTRPSSSSPALLRCAILVQCLDGARRYRR